jgi:hypothetical protein
MIQIRQDWASPQHPHLLTHNCDPLILGYRRHRPVLALPPSIPSAPIPIMMVVVLVVVVVAVLLVLVLVVMMMDMTAVVVMCFLLLLPVLVVVAMEGAAGV